MRDYENPTPAPARLRTPEAAAYVGASVSYMNKARVYGSGPPFFKTGKWISYSVADLDAWMATRKHASTSEYTTSAA